MKELIVIVGPTGVGKTDVAIQLALALNTEIISCDSRQIFKEMFIGTAVPEQEQLQMVKHHLIQNKSIFDNYNASVFEQEVIALLDELFKTHDKVIMVGGSGLYVDAVCRGIDDLPNVDAELRRELTDLYFAEGIKPLQDKLRVLDPEYYKIVDLNNYKRIQKGIEISLMTGKPYSSFLTNRAKERSFQIQKIGLNIDRALLHERINKRVDVMLEKGLEDEVKSLYPIYKHQNMISLNTVGYREFFDSYDGVHDKDTAIELIKRNTRRYARRQITYFSKDKEMRWFQPVEIAEILAYINA